MGATIKNEPTTYHTHLLFRGEIWCVAVRWHGEFGLDKNVHIYVDDNVRNMYVYCFCCNIIKRRKCHTQVTHTHAHTRTHTHTHTLTHTVRSLMQYGLGWL